MPPAFAFSVSDVLAESEAGGCIIRRQELSLRHKRVRKHKAFLLLFAADVSSLLLLFSAC